jgi:hypothetical protein
MNISHDQPKVNGFIEIMVQIWKKVYKNMDYRRLGHIVAIIGHGILI